jgi:hypothetical protein
MYDMKKFLELSAEEQQERMYEWLSAIAEANEEERQEKIWQLTSASAELDEANATTVIKVRTLALAKLSKDQVRSILHSRAQAMRDFPEINEKDRMLFFTTVREMPTDIQKLIVEIGLELRDG